MPTTTIPVPVTVSAGAAVSAGGSNKTVEVSGTFSATIQLQGRITSGGAWLQIGSDITAPGFYAVAQNVTELRFNTTVYTSGTPVAVLKQDSR